MVWVVGGEREEGRQNGSQESRQKNAKKAVKRGAKKAAKYDLVPAEVEWAPLVELP